MLYCDLHIQPPHQEEPIRIQTKDEAVLVAFAALPPMSATKQWKVFTQVRKVLRHLQMRTLILQSKGRTFRLALDRPLWRLALQLFWWRIT